MPSSIVLKGHTLMAALQSAYCLYAWQPLFYMDSMQGNLHLFENKRLDATQVTLVCPIQEGLSSED